MFNAKVTRPDFESDDAKVKLTAVVKSGNVTKVKEFTLVVKKEGLTDEQAVIKDLNAINIPKETSQNLVLPTEGVNGTTIKWSSGTPGTISNTGIVVRPDRGESPVSVVLTATVSKGATSQDKPFTVAVQPWTVAEELQDAIDKITWELIRGTNVDQSNITEDLVFPSKVGREVTVTLWKSSNENFCTSDGQVTRPTYTQGPVNINVTASLTHENLTESVTIDGLWIKPTAITNTELVELAKIELVDSMFLGENESLSKITETMLLPKYFDKQSLRNVSMTWSITDNSGSPITNSNVVSIIDNGNNYQCVITRPSHGDANYQCRLKAEFTAKSVDGGSQASGEKSFAVTVLKQDAPVSP